MGYKEMIESLRNPPEDGLPDSIYDDLSAEYDGLVSGSEAKIAEHVANNDSLSAENSALKAQNYDLLMSVQNGAEPTATEITDESNSDDSVPTLDDLFTTED